MLQPGGGSHERLTFYRLEGIRDRRRNGQFPTAGRNPCKLPRLRDPHFDADDLSG